MKPLPDSVKGFRAIPVNPCELRKITRRMSLSSCRLSPARRLMLALAAFVVVACSASGLHAQPGKAEAFEASRLYHQGQYEEAQRLFEEAVALNPQSDKLQYALGLTLLQQEQYERALEHLQAAVEVSPSPEIRRDAAYNAGVTQFRRAETIAEQAEAAVTDQPHAQGSSGSQFRRPGTAVPASPAAQLEAEAIQQQLPLLNEALESFRQAVIEDPTDQTAKENYQITKQRIEELRRQQQQQQQQQQPTPTPTPSPQGDPQQQEPQPGQKQQDEQDEQDQTDEDQQQDGQRQDPNQQPQDEPEKEEEPGEEQDRQDEGEPEDGDQDEGDGRQEGGLESTPTPTPGPGEGDQRPGPTPQPTPGADQGGSPAAGQGAPTQPLTPEQMDALRVLNSLEEDNPEQFKRLFRFRGGTPAEDSIKDW